MSTRTTCVFKHVVRVDIFYRTVYDVFEHIGSAFKYFEILTNEMKKEYLMMTSDKKESIKVTNSRYRLNYHIMGPNGWINDPNGLSYFKGYYHVFFQHHPYSADWGPMHWGHARSKDLIHWESLPIALFPDTPQDADGCFSGSAIVVDDKLYLMYTGHVLSNPDDPDSYTQNQNIAFSSDGINFQKSIYNPVIPTPPDDNSKDFRDPKIWYANNHWFSIIGSKNKSGLGRALLYSSQNLKTWSFLGSLAEAKNADAEGYVWECPDFFKLDGSDILIVSPQGIKPKGNKYKNLFQTGYYVGDFDYKSMNFNHNSFSELDYGHDFYAPQSFQAPDGRRILLGWMNMWESDMPEKVDGWAGALTFPRELNLINNKLHMNPIEEIQQLRTHKIAEGNYSQYNSIVLPNNSVEYLGTFDAKSDVQICIKNIENNEIFILKISSELNQASLQKYNDFEPRVANLSLEKQFDIHILIDSSSAEIFINNGEAVFTERFYDEHDLFIETSTSENDFQINAFQLSIQ